MDDFTAQWTAACQTMFANVSRSRDAQLEEAIAWLLAAQTAMEEVFGGVNGFPLPPPPLPAGCHLGGAPQQQHTRPDAAGRNRFATLMDDDEDEVDTDIDVETRGQEPNAHAHAHAQAQAQAPAARASFRTNLRLYIQVRTTLGECYAWRALRQAEEREWLQVQESWMSARDQLIGAREQLNLLVGDQVLEEADDPDGLVHLQHVVNIPVDMFLRISKEVLGYLNRRKESLERRLAPQLLSRDFAKARMGGDEVWRSNPYPKQDYAQRREADEKELRLILTVMGRINTELPVVQGLRI